MNPKFYASLRGNSWISAPILGLRLSELGQSTTFVPLPEKPVPGADLRLTAHHSALNDVAGPPSGARRV